MRFLSRNICDQCAASSTAITGEVIGIVSHVSMSSHTPATGPATGPAFAVSSNLARQLMLEEPRTWLGFEAALIDGPFAAALNLPRTAGLLVQSVADGSLGARLGLQEGTLPAAVGD